MLNQFLDQECRDQEPGQDEERGECGYARTRGQREVDGDDHECADGAQAVKPWALPQSPMRVGSGGTSACLLSHAEVGNAADAKGNADCQYGPPARVIARGCGLRLGDPSP